MNMQRILQQLDLEDFHKMLAACTPRERLFLQIARLDTSFEYHIDLPGADGPEDSEPMEKWLADDTRFLND